MNGHLKKSNRVHSSRGSAAFDRVAHTHTHNSFHVNDLRNPRVNSTLSIVRRQLFWVSSFDRLPRGSESNTLLGDI